jgi:hypothetical protein
MVSCRRLDGFQLHVANVDERVRFPSSALLRTQALQACKSLVFDPNV